jgi:hypothetical protein
MRVINLFGSYASYAAFCSFCAVAVRTWNHRKRDDVLLAPQINNATGAGVEQWEI